MASRNNWIKNIMDDASAPGHRLHPRSPGEMDSYLETQRHFGDARAQESLRESKRHEWKGLRRVLRAVVTFAALLIGVPFAFSQESGAARAAASMFIGLYWLAGIVAIEFLVRRWFLMLSACAADYGFSGMFS